MKTILEYQDDLSHAVRSAEDIQKRAEKDNRPMTSDETKAVKDFLHQSSVIKDEINKLKEQDQLREQTQAIQDALKAPEGRKTPVAEPASVEAVSDVRVKSYTQRFGALKAYTNKSFGQHAEAAAYKCGQWLLAKFYNNTMAKRWCENNGVNINAAMSEGVNTAGGNLVPDEMSQAIIDLREMYGVFRANCRVRPMGSEPLRIPRVSGHVTATFVPEATAGTASDMAFDMVTLVAKKLYGGPVLISSELAEDAVISVVDAVTRDLAWAFALKEDQCGFTGDGSATYSGIRGLTNLLTTASGLAGAVAATSGHDTLVEVDEADLAKVMGALPEFARPNAKFYCSNVAKELVFGRVKALGGGNTIQTLQGGVQDTYLGYPIVVSQVLPTSTSTINGTALLFFGDLTMSSSLGDRRGISVSRSDEYKWAEDQISLKATERFDIVNHDIGTTSAAGPIVGLMGTS